MRRPRPRLDDLDQLLGLEGLAHIGVGAGAPAFLEVGGLAARAEQHHEGVLQARVLLDAGADLTLRNDQGRTALFYAEIPSRVFDLLIGAGADVHARDSNGNTLLMDQITKSLSLAAVDHLLELGVDPAASNIDNDTAVIVAGRLGLTRIVDRLCVRGAG